MSTLTADEQVLLDFATGVLPDWMRSPDEVLASAAKGIAMARTHGDYLFSQSLIVQAAGPTADAPDWLDQHARDRGTSRQAGESDLVLRARLRVVPDAITRAALLDAANAILAAAGVSGSAALLELPRDAAYLGAFVALTGTGGTFAQVGSVSKFTPAVLPWPTPPFRSASVTPVRQHTLTISTPGSAYPASAAAMNAAVGGGTWSAGWLCEDAATPLAAAFGGTNLPQVASGGSPAYQVPGPLGDNAVRVAVANTGFQAASTAFLDADSTRDICGAVVIRTLLPLSATTTILSKTDFVGGPGFELTISNAGMVTFNVDHTAPGNVTATATVPVPETLASNEWFVVMFALDRGSGTMRVAVQSLASGMASVGASQAIGSLGSPSNAAAPFRLSRSGGLGNTLEVAALYMGVGVGSASGIPANIGTRLASFCSTLGVGNDGTRTITGLDGDAAIVTNATGIAGAAPTVSWTVRRLDVAGNVTDGFHRVYLSRGYRVTQQRPFEIIVILPFGTGVGAENSVRESLRLKKAAGYKLTVERRINP